MVQRGGLRHSQYRFNERKKKSKMELFSHTTYATERLAVLDKGDLGSNDGEGKAEAEEAKDSDSSSELGGGVEGDGLRNEKGVKR